MHDLKAAWRKRIENQMNKAGWSVSNDQPEISTVRCWFYSVSLDSGPRIAAQLTTDFYRDINSGSGVFAELKKAGLSPADQYSAAVRKYDSSLSNGSTEENRQMLLSYMACYAKMTQTWSMLPPLSAVGGIHFVAIDWLAPNGTRILRPAAALMASPLTPVDLTELAAAQLAMHLARNPHEKPKGY